MGPAHFSQSRATEGDATASYAVGSRVSLAAMAADGADGGTAPDWRQRAA